MGPLPIADNCLKPPRLPSNCINRPRLLDAIYEADTRLVTVQGAPGSGKTVLLSQYSRVQHTRFRKAVAWITVSREENDPRRFLGALSLAIRRVYPEIGERLQLILLSGSDYRPEMAMAVFCNELSQSDRPVTLMIDGCDVIDNGEIWSLLDMLLDRVDENLQLICASRYRIPLAKAQSAGDGYCYSVDYDDLRYTPGEAREFLKQACPADVTEQYFHACYDQTAGWPQALCVLAQKYRSGHKVAIDTLDSMLRDYFDARCGELSEADIEILRCCSLLNYYNTELLCQLLGRDTESVQGFVAREIFSSTGDEDRLSLHPLFHRYLQSRLERDDPRHLEAMHRKAELWHQEHGDVREAVYHGLFINDAAGILAYLEDVAVEMILRSELHTLLDWVSQLRGLEPQLSEHHEVVLELIELWVLVFMFERTVVTDRLEALQTRLDNDETFLTDTAYATLLTIKSLNYAYDERYEEAAVLAMEMLQSDIEFSHWAKGIQQNIMTYLKILSLDYDSAERFQRDLASHLDDKNLFVKTYSEVLLGHSRVKQGLFDEASTHLNNALEISSNYVGENSIAAGIAASFLAEYYYEKNELDAVERELWFRLDTIDAGALLDAAVNAYVSLARVLAAKGEHNRGHELLDRGLKLSVDRGWIRMQAACLSEQVRLAALREDADAAKGYLDRIKEIAANSSEDEPILDQEIRYYTLVARALSGCDPEVTELIDDIQQFLARLEECSARLSAVRLRIALASLLEREGQYEAMEETLKPAIRFCLESGCISPLNDCVEAIRHVIRQHIEARPALEEFADQLDRVSAEEPKAAKVAHESINLSEKEMEILTLLSSGLSNKDISDLLEVSVGTVKWHLSNIYRKMDVSSRTEAVFEAKVTGLVA